MSKNLENNNPSLIGILKKINLYLEPKRLTEIKIVLILSIFASIAESISIAMLVPFISFFVNPDFYLFNNFFETIFDLFDFKTQRKKLGFITFLFIFIILLSSFIKLKFIKISNLVTDKITSDFRIRIFNFFINQNFSFFFKNKSNEIMSNVTQKTGAFAIVIFSAISVFNSALIFFAIMLVLIINEPIFTPIIILSIILFFFIIYKIKSNEILRKGHNINQNQNFIIDVFENTVGYFPEIIIYNLKNFFSSILNKASKKIAVSSAENRTAGSTPKIYLETFVLITAALFIYLSDLGERSLASNISYLALLGFGAQKCLPLINGIYNSFVQFRGATPIILSFLKILEKEEKEVETYKNLDILNFKKSIKIENLSYKYDINLPYILNNINFEIKKGEKIVIKGKTGSGKTTLVNIVSSLLYPTTGRIVIDDKEINRNNSSAWQKKIAVVPQTIFLNDATILENIAIGRKLEEINIDRVKYSANLAQIGSFIESLPNKYNENVGERGVKLSGGQRQRIGIARALYRNASLIILDEPTNALDLETEKLFMDSLSKIEKDVTIIMISHSDKLLEYFDKIIDLDKYK